MAGARQPTGDRQPQETRRKGVGMPAAERTEYDGRCTTPAWYLLWLVRRRARQGQEGKSQPWRGPVEAACGKGEGGESVALLAERLPPRRSDAVVLRSITSYRALLVVIHYIVDRAGRAPFVWPACGRTVRAFHTVCGGLCTAALSAAQSHGRAQFFPRAVRPTKKGRRHWAAHGPLERFSPRGFCVGGKPIAS